VTANLKPRQTQHEVSNSVLTRQKRVMDLLNRTRKPLSVAELHNELGFPVDGGELWVRTVCHLRFIEI